MAGLLDFEGDSPFPDYISRLFQIESGGNPYAATGSNRGLGQFGPREEAQYGISDQNRYDPQAQARAVAAEAAQHGPVLGRVLGRDPTPAELYLSHQQGLAGASALLSNPDMPAWQAIRPFYTSDAMAQKAIAGNTYGVSNPLSMTAGDFADYWKNKFEGSPALGYASQGQKMPNDIGGLLGQYAAPQQGGFFDRLNNAFTSPLVMFGLGLASGRTPQEGIGNAASLGFQAQQFQQKQQAQNDTARALVGMGLSPSMAKIAANNPALLDYVAPELKTRPTWGVIGENPDGTKQYGWIDPRQQTIKAATDSAASMPPIPGTSISRPPIGVGGTGLGELPQVGAPQAAPQAGEAPPLPSQMQSKEPAPFDMSFSGGAYGPSPLPNGRTDPYLGYRMGLRGQALFDSLPNRLQDQVRARLEGRTLVGIRTSGEAAYVGNLARSVDPEGADDTRVQQRKTFRQQLGSQALQSVGGNLTVGKTGLKHLADLGDLYVKMGNESAGAIPYFSQFSNAVHINTNQDKRSIADAIEGAAFNYAGEEAKYYGGPGGGTGGEREKIRDLFVPSLPPDQAAALLEQKRNFMLEKVQTQLDNRDQLFGPIAQRDPELRNLMDSNTQEKLKKIDDAIAKLRAKAQEGRYFFPKQPQPQAAPSNAPALKPGNYVYNPVTRTFAPQ